MPSHDNNQQQAPISSKKSEEEGTARSNHRTPGKFLVGLLVMNLQNDTFKKEDDITRLVGSRVEFSLEDCNLGELDDNATKKVSGALSRGHLHCPHQHKVVHRFHTKLPTQTKCTTTKNLTEAVINDFLRWQAQPPLTHGHG